MSPTMMECDIEHGYNYQLYTLRKDETISNICASKCRHRGAAFKGGVAGRCLKGILELYDKDGHPLVYTAPTIKAVLSHHANIYSDNEPVISRDVYTTPLGGNKYSILYMVEVAVPWRLSVLLPNGQHVKGSPFDIHIEPAEASPYTSIVTAVPHDGYESQHKEFLVQLKDGYGNKLTRGGVDLVTTFLGDGSVTSVQDCRDGTYRVMVYAEPESHFGQLRVTLVGKDIINSPFTLSVPPKVEEYSQECDAFERALNTYKQGIEKQRSIGRCYADLCASLVKQQHEAVKSYRSTRLQIVHTLPVKFIIDDNEGILQEKRNQLIERHNRLNEQIEELSAMVRQAEDARKEVIEELANRFEKSSKIHKDAVAAYNMVCKDIEKYASSIKEQQKMMKGLAEGDKDALKKLEEVKTMQKTLSDYYKGSGKTKQDTGRIQMRSRQYMGDDTASAMISVKPDRPNTLAFWMMEGRFKPPRESRSAV